MPKRKLEATLTLDTTRIDELSELELVVLRASVKNAILNQLTGLNREKIAVTLTWKE